MLGPGRYLLGVGEILALSGFACLGATRLRQLLLPSFRSAPALLGTAVLALAILILPAELLGSFSAWDPVPYLLLVSAIGIGLWALLPRVAGGGVLARTSEDEGPTPGQDPRPGAPLVPTLIALAIAAVAVIHFAAGVKTRLSTGMTGFDSTWYHGPFAAGFFQSGDTWSLHFIAPQFLAWFYPANGEIFHAVGMLAFGRDVLSPLLNLGWLVGCLVACWCIGRPFRVAPWSLALGAVALSVPALADQAGEARNDVVGIFFLLIAVAVALNAWGGDSGAGAGETGGAGGRGETLGALLVVGLAAGLAAGTKLNFLLPAAVLVFGAAYVARRAAGWWGLAAAVSAALAGGGYWYLRNLVHAGNPLPWIHHLGPISLPSPGQSLGGREAHSVIGYLGDGSVWSDWFLPGLHAALWVVWPLLLAAAAAGLLLPVVFVFRRRAEMSNPMGRRGEKTAPGGQIRPSAGEVLGVAGLVGLASALAWLLAPTSASGPEGMPRGFESGVRYLAPALVLGLALLPAAPLLRDRLGAPGRSAGERLTFVPDSDTKVNRSRRAALLWGVFGAALLLVAAVGYPVQGHYLKSRYSDPTFSAPGLNAAFAWARDVSGGRIATTSTRQYPLFGTDLSNHVQYVGIERPHGGFEAPATCPQWRRLLDAGHYDYVVTSRDRLEPGKPAYPATTKWTESPQAEVVLKKPPTVVFKLSGPLPPSACR